jgi:hypothetical protein
MRASARFAIVLALAAACSTTTSIQQHAQRTEGQLLPAEPEVWLDGERFPAFARHDPQFPEPRRTFHVDAQAAAPGDGSAGRPWTDLQAALCRLEPGDRLIVAPREYSGPFRIGAGCRDGTADAPIQLFAHDAFLLPGASGDVLTVERAHWQLAHVQIALRDSRAAGLVLAGGGAHDVAVDHSHISEGDGAAVRITGGASAIVVSNSHIHHSGGVRIDGGAARIRLAGNHIHHNRASGVAVAGAREITIDGNRIHNDRGPAIHAARAANIAITRNRLWNCSPSAVAAGAGSHSITIERNAIVEATTAIHLDGAERTAIRRNYLENRLTAGSTALLAGSAREIRFHNNVVNSYTAPVRVHAAAAEISVANNLFLGPSPEWSPAPPGAFSFAGPNAVAGAESLAGRELGSIAGVQTVDAGKAMSGEPFHGTAPDLGIAER